MPRRARPSVSSYNLDQLEPRQMLAAPDAPVHMPATYNHRFSAAEIDAFMTGSDDPEIVEDSTATSDADMYAGLTPTRLLRPVDSSTPAEKPAVPAAPLGGKAAPVRASFVDLTSDRERDDVDVPVVAEDDQAPVIVAAAHGDKAAIAIVATWADAESRDFSVSVTRPTGGGMPSVTIHASFVGQFPVKSRPV